MHISEQAFGNPPPERLAIVEPQLPEGLNPPVKSLKDFGPYLQSFQAWAAVDHGREVIVVSEHPTLRIDQTLPQWLCSIRDALEIFTHARGHVGVGSLRVPVEGHRSVAAFPSGSNYLRVWPRIELVTGGLQFTDAVVVTIEKIAH